MKILVLGGYGLIGQAVCRALIARNYDVVGLGRNEAKGRALLPQAQWVAADMSRMTTPQDWLKILPNIDVVVNCAGVLQDGLKDNVARVQFDAVKALTEACLENGVMRLVQVSAPGVSEDADTLFYRTKWQADEHIKSSGVTWTIFKPGLVISPQSYGGTSLIRMLAAFPFVQPLMQPKTPVQTVHVEDVAHAVSEAVEGKCDNKCFDLMEDTPQTLLGVVRSFRSWLGWKADVPVLKTTMLMGRVIGLGADIAGWLGWRPALKSTSLKVMARGVTGDPAPWRNHNGQSLKTLDETLRTIPSTAQERVFARVQLAFAPVLLVYSLFWVLSGVIGLFQRQVAIDVLTGVMPSNMAQGCVVGGALIDIGIGLCVFVRPWFRHALLASIFVCLAYLIGGAMLVPALLFDPLGPLVKVLPVIALALFLMAAGEER